MQDIKEIPVTKPFLPPRAEYQALIDKVWDRNWLTNNGPLVQQLEEELLKYLEVDQLNFVTSGTIALQIAIKALGLKGEIVTTPFSYVATTSSIVWEGGKPVFVDIDPDTLNINPELIEDAITDETSGILATHLFGNPCKTEVIRDIADRHNLKVIYDAAHVFGSVYKGRSAYNFGDISIASFHATKLFHTVEGGAIISADPEISQKVEQMRNFGHDGYGSFEGVGINGKNSEFHAAMGLCNLKYVDEILNVRLRQGRLYDELLDHEKLKRQKIQKGASFNYAFYPVILNSEESVLKVKKGLEEAGIFTRRYFYPSLSSLEYTADFDTPVANDISRRILCLPVYHELTEEQQRRVCKVFLDHYEPSREI